MYRDALPRSWSAVVLVLSATLAAAPYRDRWGTFAVAVAASLACGLAMLRRRGLAQALFLVGVSTLASAQPLGDALANTTSTWTPFIAQEPGQGLWLAMRVVLLGALLLIAAAEPRGAILALVATSATVLTFVFRGLFVPWIAIASWLIGGAAIPLPPSFARRAQQLVAAVAVGAVAISLAAQARARSRAKGWLETMPNDPALASAEWRAHGNPWRARYAALAWARSERPNPGEGHLALAALELELGRPAVAKDVLRALQTQTRDAAMRDEARRRLDALERAATGAEAPR